MIEPYHHPPHEKGFPERFLRWLELLRREVNGPSGSFTPTLDFTTTGDLSVAYTTQEGRWWRIGPLVHFSAFLNCTPTFTTASGQGSIMGLPYPSSDSDPRAMVLLRVSSTGVTYPGGRTEVNGVIAEGESQVRLISSGSAAANASLTAGDFTSAVAADFRMTGFYSI